MTYDPRHHPTLRPWVALARWLRRRDACDLWRCAVWAAAIGAAYGATVAMLVWWLA